ncbi:MAG: lipase maturation factor family protein [Candidatus Latescibacterota bacterium]|nr:lipase maturation factor family protein [Candidatus Latescibacterota bacterium]
MRGLGLVYGISFFSLWTQVEGLIGAQGIIPVANYLDSVLQHYGASQLRLLPTLLWIDASDFALHLLCAVGVASSLSLITGFAPLAAAAVAWLIYLSLFVGGQDFLSFQWDLLLLETGYVSMFWMPLAFRPRRCWRQPASTAIQWVLRALMFRLMLSSGAVKLLSGDPSWSEFAALRFHYETQPLPGPLSWFAHHLPAEVHTLEAVVMFVIELVLPFAIFCGRRLRAIAAAGFALLQIGIVATGNYGYFNVLTLLLCLPLLDDGHLRRLVGPQIPSRGSGWPRAVTFSSAALLLWLGTTHLATTLQLSTAWEPEPVRQARHWLEPLRLSNSYGLFAVMTQHRSEIAVEGSYDGKEWRRYAFRYKPGQVGDLPPLAGFHMPRLDWQMWFAALRSFERTRWFSAFAARLLQGSPAVLELLAHNPFPDRPPAMLRATRFSYRFTTPTERSINYHWWWAQETGPYSPILSLRRGSDN